MAKKSRRYSKENRRRPVKIHNKFFYIDKRLYKVLRSNAPANLIEAWSFDDHERVTMLYSDYRKLAKKALMSEHAAKILNISKRTLVRTFEHGHINPPKQSYPLNGKKTYKYYWWSLDDILAAYDYLLTVHYGRPRADGRITPNQNLPSRAEIIAKMTDQMVLYAKDGDRFVPTYLPPQF